jgi:glycosyltransferase involved in cell wall biosynthesis
LPTGVDPAEAELPSIFDPRGAYTIGKADPVLLFVGRLGEEKNIQLIFEAMPEILKSYPLAKLMIVGDGPYMEELQNLSKQLKLENSVRFTGMLDRRKTFSCFQASDIFMFASTTDTQGLVINEAGIEAKPIVFVDEFISPITINKKTGLKAPGSAKGLANAAIRLIGNPELRKSYGEAAQKEAKKITIEKQAAKLAVYYETLLK